MGGHWIRSSNQAAISPHVAPMQHPACFLPEPAVSVPSAKVHSPPATATADPQEEPPGVKRSSKTLAANHNRKPWQGSWYIHRWQTCSG